MRVQLKPAYGRAMTRGAEHISTTAASDEVKQLREQLASIDTKVAVVEEKVGRLETKEVEVTPRA